MNSQTTLSAGLENNPDSGSFMHKILREPLLHFMLAAALLFLLNAALAVDDREEILVDSATQAYLIQQQEDLLLRPLSQEEKDEIVEGFIEQEILVREARRRGLDNSSRIRRLLVQNMRFFYLDDSLERPTEDQLREFFQDNIELFSLPASRKFEQVFYADPAAVPVDTLTRLKGGEGADTLGESGPFARRILSVSDKEIATGFGPQVAPAILAIDDDQWHGPFNSTQGAHFLRLLELVPARQAEFEAARQLVEAQWDLQSQRATLDRALLEMRPNYRIEVQALEGTAG